MSACDANRVSRFESRARCFVSGTEEGGKIDSSVWFSRIDHERGGREKRKRSAAMINTTGVKASLLFPSPLFSFFFFFPLS